MPPGATHVWHWFLELLDACQVTDHGRNPIGFGGLADWKRLTGNQPLPWEVALIRELDQLHRKIMSEAKTS